MSYLSIALNVFAMWCVSVMLVGLGVNPVLSVVVAIPLTTLGLAFMLGSAWIETCHDAVTAGCMGLAAGCVAVLSNSIALLVTGEIYVVLELLVYAGIAVAFQDLEQGA